MFDHRGEELPPRERAVLEVELFVLRFPFSQQLSRLHPEHAQNRVELLLGRRILEIFPDLGLDSVVTKQADRLPGLASARVVPDDNGHEMDPPHA